MQVLPESLSPGCPEWILADSLEPPRLPAFWRRNVRRKSLDATGGNFPKFQITWTARLEAGVTYPEGEPLRWYPSLAATGGGWLSAGSR